MFVRQLYNLLIVSDLYHARQINLSGQIQFVRVFFLGKFSSSRLKDKHLGDLEHFKQKHLGDLEHFNKKHLGDLELICIFALKISKL
jgi:hypothetical protein